MTRAIDRLIVSGAIDPSEQDRDTPIGWVLSQLDCEAELAAASEPCRARARRRVVPRRASTARATRQRPTPEAAPWRRGRASWRSSPSCPTAPAPRGYRLPELAPLPAPPLHRVRRLSYSALALFERCSYRYYAERVAGLRERRGTVPRRRAASRRPRSATPCTGCSSSSTCATPAAPDVERRARRGTRR